MREFFNGWRRKVGCLCLMMALVFLGGLSRSKFTVDRISIVTDVSTRHSLQSVNGYVFWFSYENKVGSLNASSTMEWASMRFDPSQHLQPDDSSVLWRFRRLGLGTGSLRGEDYAASVRFVSYWYFIDTLTILAGYLIVWTPRRRATVRIEGPHA